MGKSKKNKWDSIVIGAGAAGMMAAITAARQGKRVCVLEKLDKAGKKLYATGNGKCNYTNAYMHTDCFHGDSEFIEHVLSQFQVKDCLAFFNSIGIYPKDKNGYFYPNSEQAASVVNALLFEIERLNVKIIYETKINEISVTQDEVSVWTNTGVFAAKHLIIATGLLAAPKLGSDGSIFDIIKMLGHRFVPIVPALCGFYCKGLKFKQISGVRAHGTVSAYIDGRKCAEDTGEIQFTEYGLSGIPVFQISSYLSRGIYEKRKTEIKINLLPDFEKKQLLDELSRRQERYSMMPVNALLNGLLNQKLSEMILDKVRIEKNRYLSSVSQKEIEEIASLLHEITVSVENYRDFEFAQVCAGGIPVSDINRDTLESKIVPNVHFVGEILDVDGICGGYNLHFAWATGYMAGKAICEK